MAMEENVYDVGTAATDTSCCDCENSVSRTHDDIQHFLTNRRRHRVDSIKLPVQQNQGRTTSSSAFKFNTSCPPARKSMEYAPSRNHKTSIQSTPDKVDASISSNQLSGKSQNKLILLRRSMQYTTKLKSDPNDIVTPKLLQSKDIETENKSCSNGPTSTQFLLEISSTRVPHLLRDKLSLPSTNSKPVLDGAYDLFSLPTDISSASGRIISSLSDIYKNEKKVDIIDRRSSLSKFDFSSSWLSRDTASTLSLFSDQVDGAYDLFSLPSDSSISPSRSDSIRSLENIIGVDRLSLHDDISDCSIHKHRKVSFDSTVRATTIPSRLSYSSRMKTRLWSSTEDIFSNAIRNEKEFAFDGCDWRTASEESDFLRCPFASSMLSDDVFVHPVHFVGLSSSQSFLQQNQVLLGTDSSESGTPPMNSADEVAIDDSLGGIFDMD
jgi:hypothetical protein